MGLKDLQKEKALEDIFTSQLKSGNIPNKAIVNNLLYRKFKGNVLGLPELKLRKAANGATSNFDDYKSMLLEIENDLSLLYESLIDQNKQMTEDFIKFDNQKGHLINQLNELSREMNSILSESSNLNPFSIVFDENFSELTSLDLSKSRGLDFDLDKQEVKLKKLNTSSSKIKDVNKADIEISNKSNINIIREITPLRKSIDDFLNTSWSLKVESVKGKRNWIELLITLPKLVECNRIELTPNSPGEMRVELQYSENNDTWLSLEDDFKSDLLYRVKSFNFNTKKLRYLKIKLFKDNPDFEHGSYIYGLSNVSLFNVSYVNKGILYSNPINLQEKGNVDKITLETNQKTTNNNQIDYSLILLNDEQSKIRELNIVPTSKDYKTDKKALTLGTTKDVLNQFSEENISEEYTSDSVNLFKFNAGIDPLFLQRDSVRVIKGINMWNRSVYQYNYPEQHLTTMNDWNFIPIQKENKNRYFEDYTKDIELISDLDKLNKGELNYKFSTFIHVDESVGMSSNLLHYNHRNLALYVNNRKVKIKTSAANNLFSFQLNPGWNKIDYLISCDSGAEPNLSLFEVKPKSNGKCDLVTKTRSVKGAELRAHKSSIRLVSQYEMENKMYFMDKNLFAIDCSGLIIMNDDSPNLYQVEYKENLSSVDAVAIKAEFKTKDTNQSPMLKEYKLNFFT